MKLALVSLAAVTLFAQTIPVGFTNTAVANVAAPTALAFLPDGRMLIASQSGSLRVYQNGALLPTPALTIPASRICTNSERGLLGVAVDPEFATNSFIFLYYTFQTPGSNCGTRVSPTPMNRVSRFTMRGNIVDAASEQTLITNLPSWNGNHNAGDLQFGNDGYLYISVGDSGCDPYGTGCAGTNDAARDIHTLLGKILRIDRDGNIPADNPYTGPGSQRCNTANAPAGVRCQETYAWGLRNPFRMAFDRNDLTVNRFFILDVGQDLWEEIDLAAPGADYGWNNREGACINGSRTNCPPPPAGVSDPIYAYPHSVTVPDTQSSGCNSIAGGAFIPNRAWPAEFDGSFLFADYVCGSIFRLSQQDDGKWRASDFIRGLGANSAVHLGFGPFGDTQALYYTTYASGGQVRRIAYTAGRPNAAPTAVIRANPTSGAVPLTVAFSAQGSADPDAGDTLTYLWNFGDQTPVVTTTTLTTQHTYTQAGSYTATLVARDSQGALSQPATARIFAGNTAPIPVFNGPATFTVGQSITLSATANDAEDGPLPASALSWTLILHHAEHTHPFLGPVSGSTVTFTAPAPEDLTATETSYLEIHLQARDSAGETTTLVRELRPQLVLVTFDSSPTGLTLRANGFSYTTPHKVTSWVGYALDITAPDQDFDGARYGFVDWLNATTRSQQIITPAIPIILRARFERIGPASTATALQAASWNSDLVAPSSLVTLQGQALSSATFVADMSPWPTEAGGVRILVNDKPASIYVIAPDIATFELPAETKSGSAVVKVQRIADNVDVAVAYTLVETVAPGIFTASNDGKGLARGSVRVGEALSPLTADAVPVGAVLLLQATGIRNAGSIVARVGGVDAEVLSVTAQSFPGLDEVEIRIPASLAGRGTATIQLTADGKAANPVTVTIR